MTTALDRLEAAIGDDGPIPRELQLDLVRDLLSVRRVRADGESVSPQHAEQAAWFCRNCLREWAEPACEECGANLIHKQTKGVPDVPQDR